MAMEYFDEKIVPILKRKLPGSDVSGRLMGSPPGIFLVFSFCRQGLTMYPYPKLATDHVGLWSAGNMAVHHSTAAPLGMCLSFLFGLVWVCFLFYLNYAL